MDTSTVERAVGALQAYHAAMKGKEKLKLIEEDPVVSLIIAIKKIPNRTIRPHRIPLAHTLYPVEDTEMCLITKSDKSDVKSVLGEQRVHGVNKIISIAKLKTNFKSYELKRRLSQSYDIFLTDKRLYHMLPRLLGKKFFEKKKFPFPVDMQKKDLLGEISRARDATYLHVGLGSCCCIPIGKVGFPASHLVENICGGMKGVVNRIPRGWSNVQSVHIKSTASIALPVYASLPPAPTSLPAMGGLPPSKRKKTGHERRKDGDPGDNEGANPIEPTPKLAKKKIRGSTVVSAKMEKAMRTGRKRTRKI